MKKPLKHAIIVSHPSEASFTLAIAQRYAETVRGHGHEVILRDLYRLSFDPVLQELELEGNPTPDIVAEWKSLGEVDVFVLVYPIWFGAPPAMLKGYIDRVFGPGRMRGSTREEGAISILQAKQLVSLTLSGSMSAWLHEKGVLESLRNLFDRYLGEVFGLSETHHFHFDGVQPGLPKRDYAFHLADAKNAAEEVLARLVRSNSAVNVE